MTRPITITIYCRDSSLYEVHLNSKLHITNNSTDI
jgi:hypothetical protein